jgi:hypothetical protein
VENIEEINKRGGWIFLLRVEFFKIGKRDFTFIREMRVPLKLSNGGTEGSTQSFERDSD